MTQREHVSIEIIVVIYLKLPTAKFRNLELTKTGFQGPSSLSKSILDAFVCIFQLSAKSFDSPPGSCLEALRFCGAFWL